MIKTIIPIKGMHCRSCEILITEKLQEIKNIDKANVHFKKKTAEIYSKTPLDTELVADAIREAGYEVGEENPKAWFSKNASDYANLGIAFLIIAVLFYIGSGLGLFNISIGNSSPSSLIVVLLIGLTAGVSTCMALVGGLVLGISARHSEEHPEATAFQKFRPHLYFNLGRIASYFVLGGLIGMLGKVFQFSGPTLGVLTIIVGVVMFILGLKLIDIFPRLSSTSLSLPASIARFLGIRKHHEKEYSHVNSMIVGGLTFFLPCGFTQAMQLYAMSTGNFLSGALIMATFAIGTTPGLLSIGGLTSVIKGSFAKLFFKFAGLIVILLSIFNISNGYNLTGWTFGFNPDTPAFGQDSNVTIENGIQIVKMTQSYDGYTPNQFVVKKNLPVKWIIESENVNSCASVIVVPKLGITKNLELGENVIEFTPTDIGTVKFSCTMGMYTGVFSVVEDNSISEVSETIDNTADNKISSITPAPSDNGIQIIKTTFATWFDDIDPSEFTVKVGVPVRFEVDVRENGIGCMSTIMIPGLYNEPLYLEAGKIISMEFTPTKKGSYPITCAMGVPRGTLTVL